MLIQVEHKHVLVSLLKRIENKWKVNREEESGRIRFFAVAENRFLK